MPGALVPELPPTLAAQLGIGDVSLVLDRRGSMIWDVHVGARRYALKLGHPIAETEHWPAQPWTALAPAREAAVLDQLGRPVPSGEWERGTWNMQSWHEGPDLQHAWREVREQGTRPDLTVALRCARALAGLHAQGWAHGDVQPAHLILDDRTVHLIDLALAHGKPVPGDVDFPFRGCLVHYEAPEISARILDHGWATPTQAGDVYALGASLLMAATGRRVVIYPDHVDRTEQRAAIVQGNRRPVNVKGPLKLLIEQMLRHAPERRPAIAHVVRTLQTLSPLRIHP
ncbi:protein kinase [Streptomyces sp. NPDC005863]|uniref:protein kinase domain-containing protein n=2 Tax=unclassified Streptomyces TaxID=2593676 RepID=UPI0036802936